LNNINETGIYTDIRNGRLRVSHGGGGGREERGGSELLIRSITSTWKVEENPFSAIGPVGESLNIISGDNLLPVH
jgi:hypothetical protein